MGMFDTFIVDVVCPNCGDKITSVQTKQLTCNLEVYKIGDVILFPNDLYIDSGYLVDDAYCSCDQYKDREWCLCIENGRFNSINKL